MSISFPDDSIFGSRYDTKLTLMITAEMKDTIEELARVLGKDSSKTVRWCLEQVLKEAISQGKIPDPRESV